MFANTIIDPAHVQIQVLSNHLSSILARFCVSCVIKSIAIE